LPSSAGSEPLAPSVSFDCALFTMQLICLISDPYIYFSRVTAAKLAYLWSALASFSGSTLPRVYYTNTNTSKGIANSLRRAGRCWSGRNRLYNDYHFSLLFVTCFSGIGQDACIRASHSTPYSITSPPTKDEAETPGAHISSHP
jgi:hypothetical protein